MVLLLKVKLCEVLPTWLPCESRVFALCISFCGSLTLKVGPFTQCSVVREIGLVGWFYTTIKLPPLP